MAQDAKKESKGRPAPLTQSQVDTMVRRGAESAEIHRLIESHSERHPVAPLEGLAGEKRRPIAATPEEASRLAAEPSGEGEKMRGERPKLSPPR